MLQGVSELDQVINDWIEAAEILDPTERAERFKPFIELADSYFTKPAFREKLEKEIRVRYQGEDFTTVLKLASVLITILHQFKKYFPEKSRRSHEELIIGIFKKLIYDTNIHFQEKSIASIDFLSFEKNIEFYYKALNEMASDVENQAPVVHLYTTIALDYIYRYEFAKVKEISEKINKMLSKEILIDSTTQIFIDTLQLSIQCYRDKEELRTLYRLLLKPLPKDQAKKSSVNFNKLESVINSADPAKTNISRCVSVLTSMSNLGVASSAQLQKVEHFMEAFRKYFNENYDEPRFDLIFRQWWDSVHASIQVNDDLELSDPQPSAQKKKKKKKNKNKKKDKEVAAAPQDVANLEKLSKQIYAWLAAVAECERLQREYNLAHTSIPDIQALRENKEDVVEILMSYIVGFSKALDTFDKSLKFILFYSNVILYGDLVTFFSRVQRNYISKICQEHIVKTDEALKKAGPRDLIHQKWRYFIDNISEIHKAKTAEFSRDKSYYFAILDECYELKIKNEASSNKELTEKREKLEYFAKAYVDEKLEMAEVFKDLYMPDKARDLCEQAEKTIQAELENGVLKRKFETVLGHEDYLQIVKSLKSKITQLKRSLNEINPRKGRVLTSVINLSNYFLDRKLDQKMSTPLFTAEEESRRSQMKFRDDYETLKMLEKSIEELFKLLKQDSISPENYSAALKLLESCIELCGSGYRATAAIFNEKYKMALCAFLGKIKHVFNEKLEASSGQNPSNLECIRAMLPHFDLQMLDNEGIFEKATELNPTKRPTIPTSHSRLSITEDMLDDFRKRNFEDDHGAVVDTEALIKTLLFSFYIPIVHKRNILNLGSEGYSFYNRECWKFCQYMGLLSRKVRLESDFSTIPWISLVANMPYLMNYYFQVEQEVKAILETSYQLAKTPENFELAVNMMNLWNEEVIDIYDLLVSFFNSMHDSNRVRTIISKRLALEEWKTGFPGMTVSIPGDNNATEVNPEFGRMVQSFFGLLYDIEDPHTDYTRRDLLTAPELPGMIQFDTLGQLGFNLRISYGNLCRILSGSFLTKQEYIDASHICQKWANYFSTESGMLAEQNRFSFRLLSYAFLHLQRAFTVKWQHWENAFLSLDEANIRKSLENLRASIPDPSEFFNSEEGEFFKTNVKGFLRIIAKEEKLDARISLMLIIKEIPYYYHQYFTEEALLDYSNCFAGAYGIYLKADVSKAEPYHNMVLSVFSEYVRFHMRYANDLKASDDVSEKKYAVELADKLIAFIYNQMDLTVKLKKVDATNLAHMARAWCHVFGLELDKVTPDAFPLERFSDENIRKTFSDIEMQIQGDIPKDQLAINFVTSMHFIQKAVMSCKIESVVKRNCLKHVAAWMAFYENNKTISPLVSQACLSMFGKVQSAMDGKAIVPSTNKIKPSKQPKSIPVGQKKRHKAERTPFEAEVEELPMETEPESSSHTHKPNKKRNRRNENRNKSNKNKEIPKSEEASAPPPQPYIVPPVEEFRWSVHTVQPRSTEELVSKMEVLNLGEPIIEIGIDSERIKVFWDFIKSQNPYVQEIVEVARENNLRVYIVGGAFRDWWLGRSISDLDFIFESPELGDLYSVLKIDVLYKDRYVKNLYKIGKDIDIFVYPHGFKLEEVLKDRDALISTLLINERELHGYQRAWDELNNKDAPLTMMDDPVKLFREDPKRILRMIYLSAKTGRMLDDKVKAGIRETAEKLRDLNYFEFRGVVDKLMQVTHFEKAFNLINEFDILFKVFPAIYRDADEDMKNHFPAVISTISERLGSIKSVDPDQSIALLLLPITLARPLDEEIVDKFIGLYFDKHEDKFSYNCQLNKVKRHLENLQSSYNKPKTEEGAAPVPDLAVSYPAPILYQFNNCTFNVNGSVAFSAASGSGPSRRGF